jgi:hypothetical protein
MGLDAFLFRWTEAKAWEPAQHGRGKFRWYVFFRKKRGAVRQVWVAAAEPFFTPLWLEVVSGAVSFFFFPGAGEPQKNGLRVERVGGGRN